MRKVSLVVFITVLFNGLLATHAAVPNLGEVHAPFPIKSDRFEHTSSAISRSSARHALSSSHIQHVEGDSEATHPIYTLHAKSSTANKNVHPTFSRNAGAKKNMETKAPSKLYVKNKMGNGKHSKCKWSAWSEWGACDCTVNQWSRTKYDYV